jgi:hypothetical protein
VKNDEALYCTSYRLYWELGMMRMVFDEAEEVTYAAIEMGTHEFGCGGRRYSLTHHLSANRWTLTDMGEYPE